MKDRTRPRPIPNRHVRRRLAAGCAVFLLALLTLQPQRYAAACAESIALWAKVVLPALFPFLVLTALVTQTEMADSLGRKLAPLLRRCGLPAAGAGAFFVSILSGYPVGSRIVADLYSNGSLGRAEAERLSYLCSTSGPMFILGSVGSAMFGEGTAGAILFASHLFGVLSVFFLTKLFGRKGRPQTAAQPRPLPQRQTGSLGETVQKAVISVLCVGGFIALAGVLLCALEDLHLLAPLCSLLQFPLRPFGAENCAKGTVYGLIEATRGCASLAAAGAIGLPFAAFTITFGGASILAQQLAFLRPAGVRIGRFIAVKALQGCAAALFCLLLCNLTGAFS